MTPPSPQVCQVKVCMVTVTGVTDTTMPHASAKGHMEDMKVLMKECMPQ